MSKGGVKSSHEKPRQHNKNHNYDPNPNGLK